MQQGLLLESSHAGCPWANLEQIIVEGPRAAFDPARLRAAWITLAARHDALRMQFEQDGQGHILQRVRPEPELTFAVAKGGPADLEAFLAADRLAGVDPEAGPGWRVTLLAGQPRSVMVWTIHHALIDGTSMAIVLEELGQILQGKETGPVPPLHFAEYSAILSRQDKTAAKVFFAGMFGDRTAAPGFVPVSAAQPGRMAVLTQALPRGESDALRAAVRAAGATTLNAVQGAWALVLSRWTGQPEACFGLVDSGRRVIDGLDGTVGCLISTLPMRLPIDGTQTVAGFLSSLRKLTVEMRQHAHASSTEVRRWVGLPGGAVLFDTIVMHAHASLDRRMRQVGGVWADWSVRLVEEGTAAATLAVTDDPEIQILLEHDPSRIGHDRARALLAQVARLLAGMASAEGQARLGELEMISAQERAELLALGEPQSTLPETQPCVARRFEAVALARPDATAIIEVETGLVFSFRDLDRCANALALRLQAAGVAPGDVVGIRMLRGAAHIAALFATLKLGAAFLPLDPDLPEVWLSGLVHRAGAKAVVSLDGLSLGTPVELVADPAGRAEHPPARPPVQADRMAYVLFTSGSTGEPKAVRGVTGALSAHASATIAAFGLGPTDRVMQFAGLGFDVALEEIFPTLLAGATVVVRSEATAGSVRACLDLMQQHRVTVANLPASFWHVLVDDLVATGQRLPGALRLMVTGSERIRPQSLRRWRVIAPDVDWINGYGPTETTITATALVLPKGAALPLDMAEVPIGRPLAHARVVLRAPDGSLTPRGGRGVLWIGGPAVTGGYLGDAARTEAVFQPDPYHPGGRLYCTGDQARWRNDGTLDFLGRGDRQVKLRGHRIDLHQVEQLLAGLDGVRQAHVALSAVGGTDRLLGWVLTDPGVELRSLVRQANRRLPRVMVPRLIAVDQFPVGPNGKIDTRALPMPPAEAPPTKAPADDALTRRIAACMAEVLERDAVSSDASFSDLGGDSLLALRLVSLIEQRTGHVLQTSDLHNNGSAAALAQMLQGGSSKPHYIIPIQPGGTRPAFFAVHVLGRNEDLFRPLAAALGSDQPVYGLSVGIPRNLDDINVERTARLYFEEIQTFCPEGPIGLGAVSMAAYFAFELAQLLRAAGREVRVLAVLDAMGPDGRPALSGTAKLKAHLLQIRQHGLGHFARVLKNKIDRYRERREALHSAPDQINPISLIAANVCAVEFYRPQPYDGPLAVFRADHSFWDSPEALATGLGWASVARGGLQRFDLPGTHLSILEPGKVDVLAGHLSRLMAGSADRRDS